MKTTLKTGFLFATLIAALAVAAVDKVAIEDFVKNVDKYDQKVVTVTGRADNVKAKTSKAGNPYYTFRILGKTEEDKVYVHSFGKPDEKLKDGVKVEVTGTYRKEKKVGTMVFKNELDANVDKKDDKTKDNKVKILDK
jgi:hypothetical protein